MKKITKHLKLMAKINHDILLLDTCLKFREFTVQDSEKINSW